MDRKGRFTVFYQPDTNLMATSTIILHLNWLDLFERFVGNLMTMSLQSGYKKVIPFIQEKTNENKKPCINGLILLLDN